MNKADRWNLAYRDEIIKTFEQDVFPFIGNRPISEIKPLELLEVLRRIEKRGALEKTRKVRQRCGEMFRYAINTGRAEYNSAHDLAVALAVPKQKNHPYLSVEELHHFVCDLETYTGSIITKNATKIVMLTGVRTQEMPLSTQVIALFEQLKPITGHYPYIFTGRNKRSKPISKERVSEVIELLGYKERAIGYGFRHTMSTILHEKGFDSIGI